MLRKIPSALVTVIKVPVELGWLANTLKNSNNDGKTTIIVTNDKNKKNRLQDGLKLK